MARRKETWPRIPATESALRSRPAPVQLRLDDLRRNRRTQTARDPTATRVSPAPLKVVHGSRSASSSHPSRCALTASSTLDATFVR